MRAANLSTPELGTRLRRVACLALLALAAYAVPAVPSAAWATPPAHPEYSLAIVEGESTLPERFPVAMTSGRVNPAAKVVLSIIHNGVVVAMRTDLNGNAYLNQVPQVGDVVTLESPLGVVVASIVYDGLPSINPTVCAGSTNFSGQRSQGQTVEGGYYSLVPHLSYVAKHSGGPAQVTVLSGSSFAGYFLAPPAIGQTVWASESSQTSLAGGAIFSYSSENDRPVGACPPPAPVFHPPPPPALQGSIFRLSRITIRRLLKSGWLSEVTINQPGTVIEDLYLQGGVLPAYASSRKGRRHTRKPAALLLARGSASAASAGKVDVMIRVTPQGRRKLRHAGHVRAVLITTLRSNLGAKLDLVRRTVSLHS
jgi:hypothetical protein